MELLGSGGRMLNNLMNHCLNKIPKEWKPSISSQYLKKVIEMTLPATEYIMLMVLVKFFTWK